MYTKSAWLNNKCYWYYYQTAVYRYNLGCLKAPIFLYSQSRCSLGVVVGQTVTPKDPYVEALTLIPQDVNVFGGSVFKEVITLNEAMRIGPNPIQLSL